MNLNLEGKTAIVTGGSLGIGKAIARQLSFEGVDVIISSRNLNNLEAAARDITAETGGKVIPIVVDTGNQKSVESMVEQAVTILNRIDILVNCAAQPSSRSVTSDLDDLTEDQFWLDMNVKVMGYLRCAKTVAPHMKQNGWGRIINISGLNARQSGNTIGSMRNVSVVAMTKNLAEELGPHGINSTVVHPGATRTERTFENLTNQAESLGISFSEAEELMANTNSVRKIIDASDIAYIVAFLASPRSIAINGDVIAAGGGTSKDIHY
ncbi:MAG: SDR family oxidoreductase [SAR202 cluster bacterium]|nr:SDR family oxidoreductase [SAR202 cluster bacterium]|tara:strand:+ start:18858 stop:19658 length:801 start_codon:yes stop_codon:yes gene_type:complete